MTARKARQIARRAVYEVIRGAFDKGQLLALKSVAALSEADQRKVDEEIGELVYQLERRTIAASSRPAERAKIARGK